MFYKDIRERSELTQYSQCQLIFKLFDFSTQYNEFQTLHTGKNWIVCIKNVGLDRDLQSAILRCSLSKFGLQWIMIVLSSELLALIMWEVRQPQRKKESSPRSLLKILQKAIFMQRGDRRLSPLLYFFVPRCNLWSNQSYCMCPVVTSEICLDLSSLMGHLEKI